MRGISKKKSNDKKGVFFDLVKKINKYIRSETKIRNHRIPNVLITGIFGVIFMYIGAAGVISMTTPWMVRGDTVQHVDYVWRLYHGNIPKWDDGITYKPFIEEKGPKPQAASANPPVFYIIHAPIVGPILDSGHWGLAIGVGRAINIFLGVLCILVLAWAGWLYGGRNKILLAISVPAMSVLIHRYLRLNFDYAVEPLLVLLATLSLILNYKIIEKGVSKKYIMLLTALSVIGMSTKATYLVFFAVSLLSVMVSVYIKNKSLKKMRKALLKSTGLCVVILSIVVVSIGWFYILWNYMTSGNMFAAGPNGYTGGREERSLMDVLTSAKLWSFFYANISATAVSSTVITSFAVAGYFTLTKAKIRRLYRNKSLLLALCMALLALLGMFIVQVKFATGYGSINFRYMLPAVFPIALILSTGLLAFSNIRGQLVVFAAFIMSVGSIYALSGPNLATIAAMSAANGIPKILPAICLIGLAIGLVLLSISLFVASNNKQYTK